MGWLERWDERQQRQADQLRDNPKAGLAGGLPSRRIRWWYLGIWVVVIVLHWPWSFALALAILTVDTALLIVRRLKRRASASPT